MCSSRDEYETSIAWLNLQYKVKVRNGFTTEEKPLLRLLNGHFAWHTLNAVLGVSGAGKTTFLKCLIGEYKNQNSTQSNIFFNKNANLEAQENACCFIDQAVHENIVGSLTVRQILSYAFAFKNDTFKSNAKVLEESLNLVLREMLLDDAILERTFEQCSGGEQRRVAIGQELMGLSVKPTFLVIDEPTSGLDSEAAYLVAKCLRELASKHKMTVIASIHVPNERTLALFDKLYILARGGVAIYSGPPDALQAYLEEKLQFNIEEHQKPIEVALKIACEGLFCFTVCFDKKS